MVTKIIGFIIGILVLTAGLYYLVKEKFGEVDEGYA